MKLPQAHFIRGPRGTEPAPSERLRAREWLARAIGLASPMAANKVSVGASFQKPNQCSIGPFGSGTRNQRSNTRKKASITPTEIKAVSGQPYLPWRRMK